MKNIILIIVLVFVVLVAGAGVWFYASKNSGYSAVYLETGDVYFGKIVNFPRFGLKNVYLIQTNPQNQETPFSVQKFSKVFWGPEDYININRNEVVWTARLQKESQLLKIFKENPDLASQNDAGGKTNLPFNSSSNSASGTGNILPVSQ